MLQRGTGSSNACCPSWRRPTVARTVRPAQPRPRSPIPCRADPILLLPNLGTPWSSYLKQRRIFISAGIYNSCSANLSFFSPQSRKKMREKGVKAWKGGGRGGNQVSKLEKNNKNPGRIYTEHTPVQMLIAPWCGLGNLRVARVALRLVSHGLVNPHPPPPGSTSLWTPLSASGPTCSTSKDPPRPATARNHRQMWSVSRTLTCTPRPRPWSARTPWKCWYRSPRAFLSTSSPPLAAVARTKTRWVRRGRGSDSQSSGKLFSSLTGIYISLIL